VPGLLERKLSRRERKAFAPEVEALRNAPRDASHPDFIKAFRNLREKPLPGSRIYWMRLELDGCTRFII
jgi:hypothetical protein